MRQCGQPGEFVLAAAEQADGAVGVLAVQPFQRAPAGFQQAAGVGLAGVFRVERGDFLHTQSGRFQLAELVAQQFVAGGAVVFAAGHLGQAVTQFLPLPVQCADLRHQGGVAGIGIQQFPLHGRTQQRLVFVLAVNVHQGFAQFAQQLHGGRLAIDVSAGTAVTAEDAPQLALVAQVHVMVGEPCLHRRVGADIEAGGNLGAVLAVADPVAVRAITQHQAERVDQDRFAGARFASECRHAGRQLEIDLVNDGQLADMNVRQHAARTITAVRSSATCGAVPRNNRGLPDAAGAGYVCAGVPAHGRPLPAAG